MRFTVLGIPPDYETMEKTMSLFQKVYAGDVRKTINLVRLIMNKEERGIEVNLMQLVRKLLDNAKYIILITCICAILGYISSAFFMTPIYQAGAKMIVNSRKDQTQNMTNDQYNVSRNLVETYAVIIRSRDVLNRVREDLDLNESYDELSSSITVKSVNNTPVMQINVRNTDKRTALKITEKLMEIAPDILKNTTEAVSVYPVEQAYADNNPVSPNVLRNTVLMGFIGFVISCLGILIMVLFDNTYKTDLEVQKDLGIPVLGVIPSLESCKGHRVRHKMKKGERTA